MSVFVVLMYLILLRLLRLLLRRVFGRRHGCSCSAAVQLLSRVTDIQSCRRVHLAARATRWRNQEREDFRDTFQNKSRPTSYILKCLFLALLSLKSPPKT